MKRDEHPVWKGAVDKKKRQQERGVWHLVQAERLSLGQRATLGDVIGRHDCDLDTELAERAGELDDPDFPARGSGQNRVGGDLYEPQGPAHVSAAPPMGQPKPSVTTRPSVTTCRRPLRVRQP